MTTTKPRLSIDFSGVEEDSELHSVLMLAEEAIEEQPEWDEGRIAEFVSRETNHLCTTKDNKDLETLAELRKHNSLDDGEIDQYRSHRGYSQNGASETIEAIIKRSIDMFVYDRINTPDIEE